MLDLSKFDAFAGNQFCVSQVTGFIMIRVQDLVEINNIIGMILTKGDT